LYSVTACQKLKPILFSLNQFCDWQKETAKLLAPFPIESKNEENIFETLATIRALIEITHLAWRIDKWKKNMSRACRAFKESFKHFESSWQLMPDLDHSEKSRLSAAHFIEDCISFLETQTLRTIFNNLNGLTSNAAVSQTTIIVNAVMFQVQKHRFTSIQELEMLLELLGVSFLWISLSGQADGVKRLFRLKVHKAIKLLKEHEDRVPVWIIEALASTPYAKNNRKIQPLVKDFL